MSILEEKILKNREQLDAADPPEGHAERFQARLASMHATPRAKKKLLIGRMFLRVAAVILAFGVISFVIYFIDPSGRASQIQANNLPQEVLDAKMYYNSLTSEKLGRIEQCALSPEDAQYIKGLAEQELQLLEASSAELESTLSTDNSNRRVFNALIMNYKKKSELIDDIINRLCKI
jgi:hypothetical protein